MYSDDNYHRKKVGLIKQFCNNSNNNKFSKFIPAVDSREYSSLIALLSQWKVWNFLIRWAFLSSPEGLWIMK